MVVLLGSAGLAIDDHQWFQAATNCPTVAVSGRLIDGYRSTDNEVPLWVIIPGKYVCMVGFQINGPLE